MKVLVTGSGGLIGSEAVRHYHAEGCQAFGIDNNLLRKLATRGDFTRPEDFSAKKLSWEYLDQSQADDPICYISHLTNSTAHHPDWRLTLTLDQIIGKLIDAMP
jgi:NAD(P)-dependent dehydrogenase (short-subunit alcohol dehydrogenase family)